MFDVNKVKADFPILSQQVQGKPLVYLDNAATTQKPSAVIEAVEQYYRHDNANVHRGVHSLSERATAKYEAARKVCQQFINATEAREIIFCRGCTEAINLVANSYAKPLLKQGDEILITAMEHHSNIVPWQMICQQTGAVLKVAPIDERGEVIQTEYLKLLSDKTKFVALIHVSNALGTVNPVQQMIAAAHQVGAKVLVDGAQALANYPVDVQQLDVDFYTCSGHKVFGPTGIGFLYGKAELLEEMPPYQGGGDMILTVSFDKTTYAPIPSKFEAGTPNIAGAIGLASALHYIQSIGFESIVTHEQQLLEYATEQATATDGLTIIGTAAKKAPVLSFTLEKIHPHDIATIIDHHGVAVRAGHHCAMPVMRFFNVPATTRASFSIYNNRDDIDQLFSAINETRRLFNRG